MTIVDPSAADALREIDLPRTTLRPGNGRGAPVRRCTMLDSTLLLVAVQTVVVAGLLPLESTAKLVALVACALFALVAAVVSRRRSVRNKAVRDERFAIVHWLAVHSTLDHASRMALAWAEPSEIGERQYEFLATRKGRRLSLIIDLDIKVASLAILERS